MALSLYPARRHCLFIQPRCTVSLSSHVALSLYPARRHCLFIQPRFTVSLSSQVALSLYPATLHCLFIQPRGTVSVFTNVEMCCKLPCAVNHFSFCLLGIMLTDFSLPPSKFKISGEVSLYLGCAFYCPLDRTELKGTVARDFCF